MAQLLRWLLLAVVLIFSSLQNISAQNSEVLLPVKVKGKWGYYSTGRGLIIPTIYDEAGSFNGKFYARVVSDKKALIIDRRGNIIPNLNFDDVKVLSDSLFAVKQGQHWGITNTSGDILIAPAFQVLKASANKHYFIAGDKNGLGFIDSKGEFVVPAEYDTAWMMGDFLIAEAFSGNVIYAKTGKRLLQTHSEIFRLQNDSFLFYKGDTWGALSTSGEKLAQEWSSIQRINNNFIQLEKNGLVYLYTLQNGKIIQIGEYAEYKAFGEDKLLLQTSSGLGLLGSEGEIIIPTQYDDIYQAGNFIYISLDGKTGFTTDNGKWIIEPKYNYLEPFSTDLPNTTLVLNGEKWGVINRHGQEILPVKYREIDLFKNIAKAYEGTTTTIYDIDKNGKITGSEEYKNVLSINVQSSTKEFVRNSKNVKIKAKSGWFYAATDSKWGFKDSTGNILLQPTYHTIRKLNNNYTVVSIRQPAPVILRLGDADISFTHLYGLIENSNLKLILQPSFAKIDLNVSFNGEPDIITVMRPDGSFAMFDKTGFERGSTYTYIGKRENGLARFLSQGKLAVKYADSSQLTIISADSFISGLTGTSMVFHKKNKLHQQAYVVNEGGKWGFLDAAGDEKIKPTYDFAQSFNSGGAFVMKGNKWGMISASGKPVLPIEYNHISAFNTSENQYFKIAAENIKYGFINLDGTGGKSPRHEQQANFKEGAARVKNSKYFSFIDTAGNMISKRKYRAARDFQENFVAVKLKTEWGFIDKKGNPIGDNSYSRCGDFNQGRAWVYKNKKYGYIDTAGKMVIRPKYTSAKNFDHNGLAIVRNKSRKYGVINTAGETVIPFIYNKILPFENGITVAKLQNTYVTLKTTGETSELPKKHIAAEPFSEGLAAFRFNEKYGFIDTLGNVVIAPKFNEPGRFVNGVCILPDSNQKQFVINRRGETIIENIPRISGTFNDGLALVQEDDSNFYYMDKSGKNAFGRNFSVASAFKDGYARVKHAGKWQIINPAGKSILSSTYDYISEPSDGKVVVVSSNFYGVTRSDGNLQIKPDYNNISRVPGTNLFQLTLGDEIGYLDTNGKWFWKMQE